jgi:hypothetical protein
MNSIDSSELQTTHEAEKFNARSIRRLIGRRIDRNSLSGSRCSKEIRFAIPTMKMTAHQRHFGVDEEDTPFAFLWTHDDALDFVFSLTRPVDSDDETPIEYMILDQVWVPVADFKCRIDDECMRAQVPTTLRPHTLNSSQIVVRHCCTGETLRELIDILHIIFKRKSGFSVQVT